jgi:hypothetical protein
MVPDRVEMVCVAAPSDYPAYAPPRWLVGRAMWRFWTASPGRLLFQRAMDIAIAVGFMVVLVVFALPTVYWIFGAALLVYVAAMTWIYGPGIWRAWRRSRASGQTVA